MVQNEKNSPKSPHPKLLNPGPFYSNIIYIFFMNYILYFYSAFWCSHFAISQGWLSFTIFSCYFFWNSLIFCFYSLIVRFWCLYFTYWCWHFTISQTWLFTIFSCDTFLFYVVVIFALYNVLRSLAIFFS